MYTYVASKVTKTAPHDLEHRPSCQFLNAHQPNPRTYLLGHRALPLGAVLFRTFTGDLGQLYLGREDKQAALPQLPLSMVKASETLHPGREERGWASSSRPPSALWPRVSLGA